MTHDTTTPTLDQTQRAYKRVRRYYRESIFMAVGCIAIALLTSHAVVTIGLYKESLTLTFAAQQSGIMFAWIASIVGATIALYHANALREHKQEIYSKLIAVKLMDDSHKTPT
jgi:formate hydrogenlyase subunit 3/multisubunit Na+/H+ antiporter MnhD subunit